MSSQRTLFNLDAMTASWLESVIKLFEKIWNLGNPLGEIIVADSGLGYGILKLPEEFVEWYSKIAPFPPAPEEFQKLQGTCARMARRYNHQSAFLEIKRDDGKVKVIKLQVQD